MMADPHHYFDFVTDRTEKCLAALSQLTSLWESQDLQDGETWTQVFDELDISVMLLWNLVFRLEGMSTNKFQVSIYTPKDATIQTHTTLSEASHLQQAYLFYCRWLIQGTKIVQSRLCTLLDFLIWHKYLYTPSTVI